MREPKTRADLQDAVDLAAAWRVIADCKMYGLLRGGPEIDISRCNELIARGATVGIKPSKPAADLAINLISEGRL